MGELSANTPDQRFYLAILDEQKRTNDLLEQLLNGKKPAEQQVKEFICKQCGEKFTNQGKYLAHMRAHKKSPEKG